MTSTLGMLPVVTQSDLDKAAAAAGTMTDWEPKKWKLLKTLAPAASGRGTVELMTGQEQLDQPVAVKRFPWELLRSNPEEFNKEFPTAGEGREIAMRPIVSQMFAGVRWLHNVGIAHRDLSCENVLLSECSENGLQVKIIDFGMASLSRKVTREVRGKRSYQAPEIHGTEEYDTFVADNFSVGVIVYCMGVHYYPWESTKPGKDRSFEFARLNGLEIFLSKKRMPCNKKPIAEVFSKSFLELLHGLLAVAPDARHSMGEDCFENSSRQAVNAESTWLSEV